MIPDNIEKLKTSQYLRFIDVTPTATNPTWKVVGIGIEEMTTEYSPEVDTIKWIIEETARNDHTSNKKQSSVTQKAYKNDPCFEFVNAGRDKLNYVTRILEVDLWNETGGAYAAKMSDGLITVTSYSGEEIEFDLYFNGDAAEGTVTISDHVPTFVPTTSL